MELRLVHNMLLAVVIVTGSRTLSQLFPVASQRSVHNNRDNGAVLVNFEPIRCILIISCRSRYIEVIIIIPSVVKMEDEGRSAEESSGEEEYLNLVKATIIMGLLRRQRRCRRTYRRVGLAPFTGGGASKEIITISFKT